MGSQRSIIPAVGIRSWLIAAQELGVDLAKLIKTLGLVALPLIFLAVYLLFSWLAASADGGSNKSWRVAGALVLALVPIAIAYHLSHYFSYLMLAGQLAISLARTRLDLAGTCLARPIAR